ncbi:MAG: cutinase family protein [Actinobacteria bacterium]|nr:cutinase family protein [Actinomycetota bacterium]
MTVRRIVGGLVTALLTLIVAVAAAIPAGAAPDCPSIDAVAVPGTTQTSTDANPRTPVGILASILEPIKQRAKIAISTFYTPYPATILGSDGVGYKSSKDAGIDSTNAHLKATAARCPKTDFILTGYSQGADIAGDVAAVIGHDRGVIPANRLLGVALLADPSQSPVDQPTIGLHDPGMGFAGVRTGGFGALAARDGILSVCAPLDYYCNLPQNDLVMRFIGHLGSQIDDSDPAGSAQKLSTLFMAGLIAPATAAVSQILQLVNDPQLIPHLIQRGVMFAKALADQLFFLGGPQVAATASDLVNTATQAIALVRSRSWTAIPALIAAISTKAAAVGDALSRMRDQTGSINTSGFGPVGTALVGAHGNFADAATAVLNAISVATGGLGLRSTGVFGPTFGQFTAASVAAAFKHFAEFINGGFHTNYDTAILDQSGHTGTQILQKFIVNKIREV